MKFKSAFLLIVSLFLVLTTYAQDTTKHAEKASRHKVKNSSGNSAKDSAKIVARKNADITKDTAKAHNKDYVKTVKYSRDGYVAINYGFGIPNGDFVSTGNAQSGNIFSLSAAFPGIISHCGIAFKFDAGTNSINQSKLQGALNSRNTYSNITYSVLGVWGKYSYKTLLTGIYLTYPNKYFTVDGRILIGAMFANIPALSVNYHDSTNGTNGAYTQAKTSGTAFAMDFGIEVRYAVKPKIYILLSLDYLHAVPTFNYITTGAGLTSLGGIANQETGRQTSSDQAFDVGSFTLGIGYTISAQKQSVPKIN